MQIRLQSVFLKYAFIILFLHLVIIISKNMLFLKQKSYYK